MLAPYLIIALSYIFAICSFDLPINMKIIVSSLYLIGGIITYLCLWVMSGKKRKIGIVTAQCLYVISAILCWRFGGVFEFWISISIVFIPLLLKIIDVLTNRRS